MAELLRVGQVGEWSQVVMGLEVETWWAGIVAKGVTGLLALLRLLLLTEVEEPPRQ